MLMMSVFSVLIVTSNRGFGDDSPINLGPEEIIQANGVDIEVPGYSVPSFVDWNNDNLKDLVIGEGGSNRDGKVRVYLNVGTESNPQFSDYFYVQSEGADLTCSPSGCMGCFPRVVYWDSDERKDLLVGQANGTIRIFRNMGTDEKPRFDDGPLLQVGERDIDVGDRATPCVVDWNNDGRIDMVVGALDGKIHVYLNCGCSGTVRPSFLTSQAAGTCIQVNGSDLIVYGNRSSPVIVDLDGDGKKDMLTGNTNGQLRFYKNIGTDAEPSFSDCTRVQSNGVNIELPSSPRSRPFVCFWTGDGHFGPIDCYFDVLVGASDGKVHLYRGIPTPGDIDDNGRVDFVDFALLAAHWRHNNCGQCDGADLTNDGKVDIDDLRRFTENWLIGLRTPSSDTPKPQNEDPDE
jgi:hypothetical protein